MLNTTPPGPLSNLPLPLIMLATRILAAVLLNRAVSTGLKLHHAHEQPSLARRDISSYGGYALRVREKSCPSSTTRCGESSCCPNGTACNDKDELGGYPLCCPDEKNDCLPEVNLVYACADTSWNLWDASYNFATNRFCCAANEVGVFEGWGLERNHRCLPASDPVPTSIYASSIKQLTNTAQGAPTTGNPNGPDTTAPINPITSEGPNSNSVECSSCPSLSSSATIAISILATMVALMGTFIVWILWDRRRTQTFHQPPPQPLAHSGSLNMPVPGPNPEPPAYTAPHPQTRELHSQCAPPVILTPQYDQVQETELDGQTSRPAQEQT